MANRRTLSNPSMVPELIGLYKHQLELCKLEPGEVCVSLTDMAYNPVYGDSCVGAASLLGAEAYKITLPYGTRPTKSWGAAVKEADLVVYSTTHTLHYSEEMRAALKAGARVMMAVQPLHTMRRMKADPAVIYRTKAAREIMKKTHSIRFVSEAGTDLTMERGDRPVLAHYGVADEPGRLDFWGVGLLETAPIEGSAEGTMVLDVGDQMFYLARYVESPVKVTFKEGRIVDIKGGLDAFLLRKHIESFNEESAYMLGHITMGTDRRALWTANALQYPEVGSSGGDAESYYGNIQVEIGSNDDVNFQGANRSSAHLGHCMLNSSVYLDDRLFIDRGEFVDPELK